MMKIAETLIFAWCVFLAYKRCLIFSKMTKIENESYFYWHEIILNIFNFWKEILKSLISESELRLYYIKISFFVV